MPSVTLTVGAGHNDRYLEHADELLRKYREDTGCLYLDHMPITPADCVVPEDLAVTLLVNSQVGWRAFRSLKLHAHTIELERLPGKPLEQTSQQERRDIAAIIATMAQLPGFAASVATKVLHKKRPDLIPILDNQAIFGAYMNPKWPQKSAPSYSIKSERWIFSALNWIAFDIMRPENTSVWDALRIIEPNRSLIQLFDSVWWMHFRLTQPVKKPGEAI